MAKNVNVAIYKQTGEKTEEKLALSAEVFGIEPNNQVMFDAVQVAKSNSRQGTSKTKIRKEVSGGGKKPWRQKGTGRARAGSSRSPIWVGGGTVFGPSGEQNYKISQNKKEHKLALKSALSLKAKEGLIILDELKLVEPKTKEFVKILDALKANDKVLLVMDDIDANLVKATRNVMNVLVVLTDNVSVYDLLNADHLIMTKTSAKKVEEVLA